MKKKLLLAGTAVVIVIGGSVIGVSRAHSHSYTPTPIKAVNDTSTLSTAPTTQPAVDTQTTQVAPTTTPPPTPTPPPPAPTCTAEQQNELNVAKSNLDALKAYATAHGFITYRQSDQDVLNNKINDGLAEGCVLN